MLSSPIIDLGIGLFFVFAILATMAAAVTEAISRILGLRGVFLIRGLRALVDGDADGDGTQLSALFSTPVLANQGTRKPIESAELDAVNSPVSGGHRKAKRALPSYISAAAFATAVFDLLLPAQAEGDRRHIFRGKPSMHDVTESLERRMAGTPEPSLLDEQLVQLARASLGDIDKFRANIEAWYDDHMDRVSGWYKRYTRGITALVGAVIVIGLNVQLFTFAESLYTEQALSRVVVSKAIAGATCTGPDQSSCIDDARKQVQSLVPGLTLGWSEVADCRTVTTPTVASAAGITGPVTSPAYASVLSVTPRCSFWQRHGFTTPPGVTDTHGYPLAVTLILGWLITIFALIPGAHFWFDLINKLGSIRSTGPKPAPSSAG